MDDSGVAYMVMGEGGEMTPVTPQPSTQVVAIDNGDGTQQFAIPVMDPETGQENYIVIDPETAANITNGSAEVVTSGNQLMVVNTGTGTAEVLTTGAGLQETEAQPAEAAVMEAGEVEAGVMVMLPSGEQGLVVTGPEDLEGLTMAQPQSDQQLVTEYTDTSVKTETGINGITELQKPKLSNSSMIKIVGIQDKRPTSQISLSKPLQTKTSYTTFEPDNKQNQNRAPRKQTLGGVAGYNQDGKSPVVPKGLTGDLFQDTELVERKVQDICSKIDMTEKEKEKLRLNLMTKGLNIGMGVGRGRRVDMGRPRPSPQLTVRKPGPQKSIKCDMCKKEFPANVDESILIHHVRTVHMNKQKEVNRKRPREQTPPPETIVPETPTQEEEESIIKTDEDDDTPKVKAVETVKKETTKAKVKTLADDWEDDVDVTETSGEIKTETLVPDNENNDTNKKPLRQRQSVDKSDDLDEDQIVADVDDILKDSDNIMSDVDTMLITKKPQENE